ncbi:aminotransferase class I/II-fold pyridoxal phosphate-dependent enzyme [Longimicrobium sp.]|uniref:aminotransferase class I/II-fold pyridoxal phosphate-dependent enzyme n=1 Tax=Longimicrobium sp. TaxID=2029185 RepID=UPI002B7A8F99|nr:aminotransferase class I/II-fold pyridoxal phosphate-dependent enzyme [Longimicrobium sp.]HSU12889.1 aminotransferase class I/II-fold pyridoxal phosphate-dependent enzyme [Longimicrobium sp.]
MSIVEQQTARKAGDIFAKCGRYTAAREMIDRGLYPYFQPIESSEDTEVVIRGQRLIMVGSNNYLGLTHHPYVLERAHEALYRYGSGCTGSRFLNGTLDLHEELERRLAALMGAESALVFSTGYQTNLGVISALVTRGSVVIHDRLNHASLLDGAQLASGELVRYAHNDMAALRRALERNADAGGILISTDGVFSMEGNIVDLPTVLDLADEFGARVLVDDAHSVGVLGEHGGGTGEHYGVQDRVDLTMATFSKSFASIGGAVAGPEEVIHFLKHHARSLIFSASMPPSAVATVLACLDIMEREPERRRTLWANAEYLREGLRALGFDVGVSETPIIPVTTGDIEHTFVFWRQLFDAGVFTNPVLPPAVPESACRLRTSVMATHTTSQLDRVLDAFARVGRQLGVR